MYLEERRQAILSQVKQQGRVSVSALSEAFGVSEVTIRADLQALEDRSLLIRTHGGAIPAPSDHPNIALTYRQQQHVAEKTRIGRAAAALIYDGDAIFLDSSSTALAIVPYLKQRQLTVITNSLAVAQALEAMPTLNVVMPGGTLHHDTAALVGVEGLAILEGYNIQTGFFGAHGLALEEGLTDVSAEEAEIKARLVAMCRQVIAVLDGTKWGRVGLASFAELATLDTVITDGSADASLVAQVREREINVIQV